MQLRSHLQAYSASIFEELSKVAEDQNAIDMTIGRVEFDVEVALRELVCKYVRAGRNQYAPMAGCSALRKAISRSVELRLGLSFDPHETITVTTGATGATYSALASCLGPGDEAILLEPAFDTYGPGVKQCGAKPVPVPINLESLSVDWTRVATAVTRNTRVIVVNTPHNPTGLILTREDLDQLAQIVCRHNLLLISDEVYENVVFDGGKHISAAQHPALAQRSFTIFSLGKTFNATGWKVGYCLAQRDLTRRLRSVHKLIAYAVHTPTQYAFSEYLNADPDLGSITEMSEKKRNLFLEGVNESRFEARPTQGTLFQLVTYDDVSAESDVDFALRLAKDHKIVSIPVSVLCTIPPPKNYLRFCFARNDGTIQRAVEILQRL